ncbi:MAG: hypothetical protein AAGI07_15870 [Bacteroidota bacterium]
MAKSQLVPSIRGKIKTMVMGFEANEPHYIAILEQLDKKMSKHTEIVIFCRSKADLRTLQNNNNWKWTKRMKFSGNFLSNLSRWIRDPLLAINKNGQLSEIIELNSQAGIANYLIQGLAEHISMQISAPEKNATILNVGWFEADGGNILVDQNFILIGWNDFQKIMIALYQKNRCINIPTCYRTTKQEILNVFNQGTSTYTEVIIIGEPPRLPLGTSKKNYLMHKHRLKLFTTDLWRTTKNSELQLRELMHLDLFLSLTGQMYQNKPVVFLAYAVPVKPSLIKRAVDINNQLRRVQRQLETRFHIMRNLIPVVENSNHEEYTCFYNNCLVEVTDSSNKVWIPSFGTGIEEWKKELESFDSLNMDLWKQLGFEAYLIESDFHNLCENGRGALHCITNEMIRF